MSQIDRVGEEKERVSDIYIYIYILKILARHIHKADKDDEKHVFYMALLNMRLCLFIS